jgi:hypothetical protein
MSKPNLIFLDIDGPVITEPCFFIDPIDASIGRTVMSTHAIGYLKEMVRTTNSLIVMNSTHNTHDIEDPLTGRNRTIKDDLIYWGMKEEEFHTNWKTEFPNPKNAKFSENRRLKAINNWLEANGDHVWIAFDDEYFHSENQYTINIFHGIDYNAYVWGIEKLTEAS